MSVKEVHNYDVPLIKQSNSKCCWYASFKMLYGWNNHDMSEVRKRLNKVNIYTDDALDISKWGTASRALGLKGMRVSHLSTYENLIDTLNRWGPMWCAGEFLEGSPHVIVLSGWNQKRKTVRFIDPYELWKSGTTSDYGHSYWWARIKNAEFACQQWA